MFVRLISRFVKRFCYWVANVTVCEKIIVMICKVFSVYVFVC